MWEVVAEYFNLFRYGTDQSNYVSTGSGISRKAPDAQRQQAFLRSAMTSDVNLGDSCGVDALFDQWRSYSVYFEPLQLRLRRVSKVSDRFLWASATLSVTISEITIQNVFPHISAGHISLKRQERLSCIRLALLNKRLILPYRLCFEWDDTRNRVVRILTTLDFFSPILHAVKSIEDAALVLQHARINLNGVIHNI
ncbi:hypothetical protein PHMEG_0005170 [Phytophthora megakarya]|uniref:Bzip transcription factor n=1 Tax=Phytophthora megakarya TaxID=4795 RepID=A0A225WS47_9STRA|nr:hypothetical protein PHMEG_0005170 [Phytophthora megakarya]